MESAVAFVVSVQPNDQERVVEGDGCLSLLLFTEKRARLLSPHVTIPGPTFILFLRAITPAMHCPGREGGASANPKHFPLLMKSRSD